MLTSTAVSIAVPMPSAAKARARRRAKRPRSSSPIPVHITVDSEFVADTRHGADHLGWRGVAELAAQILHVDVDGAFVGVEGLALELPDQFESAPDPPGAESERGE